MLTLTFSCKDKGLAIKYFNYFAWNYFPVARKTATQWHSEPFDYNSIMIYSSVTDVRDELGPGHYSISTLKGDYIYTGGNPDPELAGPSPLDILRVAQLYSFREFNDGPPRGPPPGKRSDDANALPSKLPTLEFVVSGQLTTTIAPTPTDFPKSMNDSKAIDLMKKFAALCNGGCHGDSVAQ